MSLTIVRRPVPAWAGTLVDAGLSPVLARIYAARGISSVAELDHGVAALPSFESLKDIDRAAERLVRAIDDHERIVIVADYDADGATACAVGVLGLRAMGAQVDFVVPNRFEFGYGLTPEIVTQAAQLAPRLLVTVDNGIASCDGVAAAVARGIDVLVTDHHLPGAQLPAPAIIVNPNQLGCAFPSKNIAGVGVMFYVLLALRARLRQLGRFAASTEPNLAELLDLVALGTVADVVRLDQVNRILVEQGLRRMRAGRARPGVRALFEVAGRDAARATPGDLGFVAGPRLNAAGRLADMSLGIRCLLASSMDEALPLARELDRLNQARREVETDIHDQAIAALEQAGAAATDESYSLCMFGDDWHQGVVGIVASRLKDRYHRPTVVFAKSSDGELKGSGRSIPGFHLRDALDLVDKRAPGTVRRFGGHAFAAGVSIAAAHFDRFAATFEAVARELLTPSQLRQALESDGPLAAGELHFRLAEDLAWRVWGQGFAAPAFDDTFTVTDQRIVAEKHARLTLNRGGERFEAMAFRQPDPLPARISALFRPEIHEWNGLRSLQLVIDHWQAA
ncbi:MAG TPA: single-stranded-DNA-specific exonuclease RecJ [Casimicrobiaceae bacterium]|nr:single-stranded-DNA-specific exonuclease RecJ [Casimicrobiaceae bacterium]